VPSNASNNNGRMVSLPVGNAGTAGDGREAVVRLLLEKGADFESKDRKGRTPLGRAARSGREAMVQLLLEKSASFKSKNREYGQSAN
jgi:ankyrin repeat protein